MTSDAIVMMGSDGDEVTAVVVGVGKGSASAMVMATNGMRTGEQELEIVK
jgi:hypothetical protein